MNRQSNLSLFREGLTYCNHKNFLNEGRKNILVVSAYIDGVSNHLDFNDDFNKSKLIENIDLLKSRIDLSKFDFVIATDGGLSLCQLLNLDVNLAIGDFDSHDFINFSKKGKIPFEKLPVEKDITDMEAALDRALSLKPSSICVLGGMGARLDHSLANIEHLVNYGKKVSYIYFIDCFNYMSVQYPSSKTYDSKLGEHFAVLSHSDTSTNVTLEGSYYPLESATLHKHIPLGVSNSFINRKITLSFDEGCLVVVISNYK